MSDRRLLYAGAFLRALATGLVGVLVGIFLARRGFDAADIGLVVGAGLAGAAVAALMVTVLGDRLGRRRVLVIVALLGAAGGAGTVFATELGAVVVAAFLGMLNGMGRDRGASVIVDQAILPATAGEAERTAAFAWYNVLQDAGHALGGLLAGAPSILRQFGGVDELAAARATMLAYCGILLATAAIYSRLSSATEAAARAPRRLGRRASLRRPAHARHVASDAPPHRGRDEDRLRLVAVRGVSAASASGGRSWLVAVCGQCNAGVERASEKHGDAWGDIC